MLLVDNSIAKADPRLGSIAIFYHDCRPLSKNPINHRAELYSPIYPMSMVLYGVRIYGCKDALIFSLVVDIQR